MLLNLLQALVYSGCLAFWIVAGLASLHFAWHSNKYFPKPQGPMFGLKLRLLVNLAHLLWDVAFCGVLLVAVHQILQIWKAVMLL